MSEYVVEVMQTYTLESTSVECFLVQSSDPSTEDLVTSARTCPKGGISRGKSPSPGPRKVHYDEKKRDGRRGRSLGHRHSRRQSALVFAYVSKKNRTRLTVDALPKVEEGGEQGERARKVVRADSVSTRQRRGRGYFRGAGNEFSTSAVRRRKGRLPGDIKKMEVFSEKGALFGRALSRSPERLVQ